MNQVFAGLVVLVLAPGIAGARGPQQQPSAPQPYPQAGQAPATPQQPGANRTKPVPTAPAAGAPARGDSAPDEAMLGLPVYPAAQYITSYDAGRGQRFYLFGTTASFADVVAYYKSVLKTKGDLVFDEPATHMFEVGRFREATIGFPPGVTVKDYTWGGRAGFPNPKPGVEPAHFRTVVQLVPAPAPAAAAGR